MPAECGAGCYSATSSVLRTLDLLRTHPAPHSAHHVERVNTPPGSGGLDYLEGFGQTSLG